VGIQNFFSQIRKLAHLPILLDLRAFRNCGTLRICDCGPRLFLRVAIADPIFFRLSFRKNMIFIHTNIALKYTVRNFFSQDKPAAEM
jgi:hypothetical protein